MEDANHGAGESQGASGPDLDNPVSEGVYRPPDKGGRPPVQIDLIQLEKLCHIHASQREIAAFFNCSVDTIQARSKTDPQFAAVMERGYCGSLTALRRRQLEAALEGNPTMLIWMGKQLLAQRDTASLYHSGPDGKPLMDIATARALLHKVADEES